MRRFRSLAAQHRPTYVPATLHGAQHAYSLWLWHCAYSSASEHVENTGTPSADPREEPSTLDTRAPVPRGTCEWQRLFALLSLDHSSNLGAEGVESEGFRQHVHASIKKIAPERGVLGISGNEKHF